MFSLPPPTRFGSFSLPAQRFQLAGKPLEIDLTSSGVKIEMSSGEFAELPESTSKCQAWYGVFSQVFEQTSRKIAHIQHRFFRKVMMLLNKCLTGRTGASGGMFKTVCPCHINPAVDRVNPCGTGKGNHNPCRSKDRDPTLNAQPWIPGFQGKFFSSGNRYRDPNICSSFVEFSNLFQMLTDHFSGNRIDCRFSNRKGKAGFARAAAPNAAFCTSAAKGNVMRRVQLRRSYAFGCQKTLPKLFVGQ